MTLMPMTIKRANALYKKLIRQYGMKEGWFNEDWHIKNARLNVGGWDFEILRFSMREGATEEPIYVFTKFIPLECSKSFTGWTNTAENVSSEEDAHKLIDNIIKQLKDGYIKHKKEWIEGDFNGYQRCSKSN